jgi:hypothetical protein
MKLSLFGILPAAVRYDKSLPDGAKLLYAEITAAAGFDGYCDEDTAYFIKCLNCNSRTIFRHLMSLEEGKYIERVKVAGKRCIKLAMGFDKYKAAGISPPAPHQDFSDEYTTFFSDYIKRFENGMSTTLSKAEMYYPTLYQRLAVYSKHELVEALDNRIAFVSGSEWHQLPENKPNISDIMLLIGDDSKVQKWLNTKANKAEKDKLTPFKFE